MQKLQCNKLVFNRYFPFVCPPSWMAGAFAAAAAAGCKKRERECIEFRGGNFRAAEN